MIAVLCAASKDTLTAVHCADFKDTDNCSKTVRYAAFKDTDNRSKTVLCAAFKDTVITALRSVLCAANNTLTADGAASANPSRGPPPRAQPPSVARGNANNIVRDGEAGDDDDDDDDDDNITVLPKTETFCCISAFGASKTCPRSTGLTNQGALPTPPGWQRLFFLLLFNPSHPTLKAGYLATA
ncbi:hypothetical protein FQN60_018321, partial [Etheostoma spectabile]